MSPAQTPCGGGGKREERSFPPPPKGEGWGGGWQREGRSPSMKFTWFHLMPWPHMPDDFRQKHRSVWVDLPNKMYQPELGHIAYHQYLDQLEYAEQVGFDGIGVNEHHANAYGLMPSPNIMAATLTRRTSTAALVVLGNSIAL